MTISPPKEPAEDVGVPAFLRIEEAAEILRISRTTAYELARRFEDTAGAEGLPVIRLGRSLRVPRRAIESWANPRTPSSDAA